MKPKYVQASLINIYHIDLDFVYLIEHNIKLLFMIISGYDADSYKNTKYAIYIQMNANNLVNA